MESSSETKQGVVITTSDYHVLSNDYLKVIKESLVKYINLEIMHFAVDTFYFNLNDQFDKSEKYVKYRIVLTVDVSRFKNKCSDNDEIAYRIYRVLFKKYRKAIVFH